MNITFLINSMQGGGAERVVSILASFFCKSDNISIITTTTVDKICYKFDNRIHFYLMSGELGKNAGVINKLFYIYRSIKKEKPQIIISFLTNASCYAVIFKVIFKYKLIISERMDPSRSPNKKTIRLLRNILYCLSSGMVFQTPDAAEYYYFLRKRKNAIIQNPVNNKLPRPFKGERIDTIVTAVRLTPQKNLFLLLDAFEKFIVEFPSYSLDIYGEGESKGKIIDYIKSKRLDGKVILKGFSENLHEEILKAKMFVLSSDYEGMSNSLIEAMSVGLPVISTDHPVGGARMIIQDGVNGYLVPVGDCNSMVGAMIKLAKNKQIIELFSENAAKIRIELSEEKIGEKWLEYIKSFV